MRVTIRITSYHKLIGVNCAIIAGGGGCIHTVIHTKGAVIMTELFASKLNQVLFATSSYASFKDK